MARITITGNNNHLCFEEIPVKAYFKNDAGQVFIKLNSTEYVALESCNVLRATTGVTGYNILSIGTKLEIII